MNKRIILVATIFGAMAVILGAFGAHSLKAQISVSALGIWQKGVEYQFYHTFALLFLSSLVRYKSKLVSFSFVFFSLGILLFSGSLYLLALKEVFSLAIAPYIGPITPVGGLFFILGWVFLFLATVKHK